MSSQCPVQARAMALTRVKNVLKELSFSGSAPAPFIGRFGYPHISVGILTPPDVREGAWEYDAPKHWVKESYKIPEIVELRSGLVQSRSHVHVKEPGRIVELAQLVGMADRPVDVEVELSRLPRFSLAVDSHHAPMGAIGEVVKAELTSNPHIPAVVEKVVADVDLRAVGGLTRLYDKGVDELALAKLLSVGTLGLEKNRRLVPTRWSITATDDVLGKHLHRQVLDFALADVQAFFGGYLGNYYLVLFLTGSWGFELFEIALPGVYDPMGGVSSDYEGLLGRTTYADNCAGGYYTVRLAALEKLRAMKRQAQVLVFRFISSEYTIPLGVWVTREATRQALESKPISFSTLDLALTYARHLSLRKFGYDVRALLDASKLLRSRSQKRLQEFS